MQKFGLMLALSGLLMAATSARAEGTRIGGGVHYWRTVDSLEGEIDDNGLAPVVSVQQRLGDLLALQLDVELYPDGFAGSDKDVLAPQAFVLLGSGLYAGLGIGTLYADSNFSDNPFFILRAGIDLELLPELHVDVNANYQFSEWDGINTLDEDVDSDTITLGAALRIDL